MSTSAVSDASAITLMSTDIERIGSGLREMHEVYANFIEVVLALWLLARLLKIATVAATLLVIGKHISLVEKERRVTNSFSKVCLVAGIPLSIASGNAQGIWLEAVEDRVAVTSKVLGVIKNIKITGLTDVVANNIRKLRSQEVKASFPYRLYTVVVVTLCWSTLPLARIR